jgi:hypothetical protein
MKQKTRLSGAGHREGGGGWLPEVGCADTMGLVNAKFLAKGPTVLDGVETTNRKPQLHNMPNDAAGQPDESATCRRALPLETEQEI